MKRRSLIPLIPLAVAFAAAPAFAQNAAVVSDQDARQAAESIESKWMANFNAGDAAAIAALFTANGSYATQGGPVWSGPQTIQEGMAARMKAGWTKVATTVSEAHASGDAVWLLGEYALTGSGPNSGKQINGHFVKVLTRDGGDWRIRMLIANATPAPR